MYETYLQNEREFENEFVKNNGKDIEDSFIDPNGSVGPIKSHNRLSLIKVMKALEKELEGKKRKKNVRDRTPIRHGSNQYMMTGVHEEETKCDFNKGLQLSLDKIREFIKLLEKEV